MMVMVMVTVAGVVMQKLLRNTFPVAVDSEQTQQVEADDVN